MSKKKNKEKEDKYSVKRGNISFVKNGKKQLQLDEMKMKTRMKDIRKNEILEVGKTEFSSSLFKIKRKKQTDFCFVYAFKNTFMYLENGTYRIVKKKLLKKRNKMHLESLWLGDFIWKTFGILWACVWVFFVYV